MGYKTSAAFAEQFIDDNGDPAENHTLEFFVTGTSTPANVGFDSAGSSTATSVTIGANGFPQNSGSDVDIFFDEDVTYKIVRKDSGGVAYGPTIDPFTVNLQTSAGAALGVKASAGSAADAITASLGTSPGSLYDQLQVVVELTHGSNTIANPTFNLNSLGTKTVVRDNNKPLRIGDTGGSGYKLYLSYSSTLDVWVLLNPAKTSVGLGDTFISGLKTTNNSGSPTTDVDTTAGYIADSTGSVVMESSSTYTKQIDAAWVAGSAAGGLPSGATIPSGGWIKYFMIMDDDGTTDFGWDTSATASNLLTASGYTYYQWIDEHYSTDGSTIEPWVLSGRTRILDTPVSAASSVSTGGTAVTCRVPAGRKGIFMYRIGTDATGLEYGILTQTDQSNLSPGDSSDRIGALAVRGDGTYVLSSQARYELSVDGSSQIRHREESTIDSASLAVLGWS